MATVSRSTPRRKRASDESSAPATNLGRALTRLETGLAALGATPAGRPAVSAAPDARPATGHRDALPDPVNPPFFAGHDSDRDRASVDPVVTPAARPARTPVDPAVADRITSFDPTDSVDGDLLIRDPANGDSWHFRIETRIGGPLDGRRIASILGDRKWIGFAFVDDFGVHVWRRLAGSPGRPSDYDGYARMLGTTRRLAARGYQITFLAAR